MKKSFSAKRIPRRAGADEDAEEQPSDSSASSVKRPTFKAKRSSQISRFSAADHDDTEDSGVVTPKRSTLSRIALQRSAGQRSSFLTNELPRSDDEGPSYSAADLQALKDSTPSTPLPTEQNDYTQQSAIDVRDKFGGNLARYEQQQGSAIPSATEIAEKKARRARLALEAQADEYISLDPDNPGWEEDEDGNVMRDQAGRLVLKEKDKYGIQQSRLVRDDEDIMEGFDDYTGEAGSRITMGASSLPQNVQARRNDISAQIAYAEGGSESGDSDFDEKSRNKAFEQAQTRRGAYETTSDAPKDPYAEYRARTPPYITPLPTMDAVMQRLRATLLAMEDKKRAKEAEMLRLTQEKFKIRDEETRVQAQLQEVAEKFRQLKMEKGFLPRDDAPAVTDTSVAVVSSTTNGYNGDNDNDDDDDYDERPTMGLGAARPGHGMTF